MGSKRDCRYHVVFATKYRYRILDADVAKRISSYLSDSIAVGNLVGIRGKGKAKFLKGNRLANKTGFQMHKMPFGRAKDLLEYKANLAGVPILFVNEAYTSQTCSCCCHSQPENRNRRQFHCLKCGIRKHADLNGAANIAAKARRLSGMTPLLEEPLGNPAL